MFGYVLFYRTAMFMWHMKTSRKSTCLHVQTLGCRT